MDRVPGFRRAGVRGSSIATGVAGGQRAGFPARGPRAVGKANLADHRGAVRFAGSTEDAIGTTGSATAIRSIASPAFARRMVVIIMIAMLGCGLVLGLTHAVPWVSATDTSLSGQLPADESAPVEVQAAAPQNSRTGDMMPLAAPAGVVQPAPRRASAQTTPTSSASIAAPPDAPAVDQPSAAEPLNPPVNEASPEPTAAVPADEKQVPVAHEKATSKKTSAPKVATKKPAKRAATQDSAVAEAPAQFPAIDVTTPR